MAQTPPPEEKTQTQTAQPITLARREHGPPMNEIAEEATAGNGHGRGDKKPPKTTLTAQNDQRPPEMTTGTATVEDNILQRHSDAREPKNLASYSSRVEGMELRRRRQLPPARHEQREE